MHRSQPPAGLRVPLALALTAVFALSVAGCGFDEGQGGIGVPVLSADEHVDAEPAAFEGVLDVASDGCMRVSVTTATGATTDRWAVWPDGAELIESGDGARVGDQTFGAEDRVTGTGRLVDLAAMPGGQDPGSYFEGSGRFCDAQVSGVLVIDEIRHA